jgi:Calx-beta domain
MSTSNNKGKDRGLYKKQSVTRLALAIVLAGFSLVSQADKITSIPSTTVPGVQDGFGGFNFDNVDVVLDGDPASTFDTSTGAYSFAPGSDFSYESRVYDDDVQTTMMGIVLAKDWPVGEPAGIKIVNDDTDVKAPKPENCIMSTSYIDGNYLDEADPQMVICSSSFQSHKRYKLAMLPATVAGGAGSEAPIDLVFNVEAEAGSRDYQVYQKINNWTGVRLKGFTIQVGTGTGGSFIAASGAGGAGLANLSLSVPDTIWAFDQLANFSTGLFGGLLGVDGYFDPDTRAGFYIAEHGTENGNSSGKTDTLTSGAILPSDYPSIPPVTGAAVNQFGDWLPNTMLPYGIFYDDDGNPNTDAELVAWYGVNNTGIGWMTGQAGGFADISDDMITNTWSNNSLYSMGVIDDLVNVGLNYIVTVGDVRAVSSSFTIRITPVIADNPSVDPTYVGATPTPALRYASSDADIRIDPSPFLPGSLLTARVMDADINNPILIDTTTVEVTTDDGSVAPYMLTLEELGEDRGAFAGNLPDGFSNVAVGTTVIVTYIDADDGLGGTDVPTSASSTAVVSLPSGNVQFSPASYSVAENGGNVVMTVERVGGTTDVVTVDYQTESGTAVGNEDYVPDSGTLVFADGETIKTITIAILDDATVEGDESFSVRLSSPQGTLGGAAIVGTNPAMVTITDTDAASGGSSGGFCSYNPDGRFDPVLPGLVLAAIAYLGWRLRKRTR